MATSATTQQRSKDELLKLLSDADVGKVSMAETRASLKAGDEYIDLDNLAAGAQVAGEGGVASMSDIIPRAAINAETWSKIVGKLNG